MHVRKHDQTTTTGSANWRRRSPCSAIGCPVDLLVQLVAEDEPTRFDQAVVSTDDPIEELPF
jgi:hypothetical protein